MDSIEEIQDAENVSISSYIVNVPRIEIINNCLLEIAVAMERSSSSAIGTGKKKKPLEFLFMIERTLILSSSIFLMIFLFFGS